MRKEITHKGITYIVTIVPSIHQLTKATGYIAYVSTSEQQSGFAHGEYSVKDPNGYAVFFESEFAAITYATDLIESY